MYTSPKSVVLSGCCNLYYMILFFFQRLFAQWTNQTKNDKRQVQIINSKQLIIDRVRA